MDRPDILIDPPLRGEWAILNPPGHPKIAFDFLATKGKKIPYRASVFLRHVFASIPVHAAYAWGRPVFAPLDGLVVASSDGTPDRQRLNMVRDLVSLMMFPPRPGSPMSAYGGNYIVLKCGDVYPLLAHLRRGTVRVRIGDVVRAGTQLAEVGNSGSSIQPHLHFQVMSCEDPFPLFHNLVPFKLRTVLKRIDGEWKEMSRAELHNGDHLRM